jgi:hypothetical protein
MASEVKVEVVQRAADARRRCAAAADAAGGSRSCYTGAAMDQFPISGEGAIASCEMRRPFSPVN